MGAVTRDGLPIGVRVGAGLLAGGALLALLLWKGDPGEVLEGLRDANPAIVLVVVAVHYASLVVRVVRWRWLLEAADCAPPPEAHRWLVTDSVFFGWLGNLVLPARLGELARPGMYARGSGRPFAAALGTSVVERVADLTVVALAAYFALAVLPVPDSIPVELRTGARASGLVAALALIGLVVAAARGSHEEIASRSRVAAFGARFRQGLRPLRDPATSARVFASTAVIWGLEATCVYIAFVAFGHDPSWSAAICHVVAVTLSIAVVTVPAGLGVEQGVTVAVLAPWGIGMADALAMSIVLSAVAIACVVPGGLLAIARQNLARRESQPREDLL